MKGLPPQTAPLRVAFQGDGAVLDALSHDSDRLILSPVETNLEISARVTQADVVVVDLTAGVAKALADIRDLKVDRPILALVAPGQERDAVDAGARGAVRKDSRPRAIAAAIEALHQGLGVFDTRFAHDEFRSHQNSTPNGTTQSPTAVVQRKSDEVLTPREAEVLALMAEGLSNKEIAAKLEISEHTAKFHVNSILQKMGAQKRVEAVVRAAKMGIIEI